MKITGDISKKTWKIEENSSTNKEIFIGFKNAGKLPVEFDNLQFKITVIDNGSVVFEESKPIDGKQYISTDQDILDVFYTDKLRLGREYSIDLWAINAESEWSKTLAFSFPIPTQPYNSWTYNEELERWLPPFQPPNDGKEYVWDESLTDWIEYIITE